MSFQFNQSHKQKPNWGRLIKQKRARLHMTQAAFGALFGVTYAAVSDWERNITDPPGQVTWWLYKQLEQKTK